jgi:hypothetical protein
MELVIKIPKDVYTRLFDNGIQDNEIATDDICEMARALRLGTPLEKHDEEVIKETVESIWGKPPYTELLDKIRDEIEGNMESIVGKYDSSIPKFNMPSYKIERNKAREKCISIINKYRKEQE